MTLPSTELMVERAWAYNTDQPSYQTFVQGLRDQYFLNAWENQNAPRMGRSGLNIINQIMEQMTFPEVAERVRNHMAALQGHAVLTSFDPYFTLVVAMRESGKTIFNSLRRLRIPRAQIVSCRTSNGTSSGTSRDCVGECSTGRRPPGTLRPVHCYNTYFGGGLDNLGKDLPNWRSRGWIPAGYDTGTGAWEEGWPAVSEEGGGTAVHPAFVPEGELLIAYGVKLSVISEHLAAKCTEMGVSPSPLPSLTPFFRRFLLQVTFGGPTGATTFHASSLDCDRVIASRPVNPQCTKDDGTLRNVGPYIERQFTRRWRSGAACSAVPDINYGIRTVLAFLRQLAADNGIAAPTLLDLERIFTDNYRRVYCRIALRRFQIGIIRAIETAALERTGIFTP